MNIVVLLFRWRRTTFLFVRSPTFKSVRVVRVENGSFSPGDIYYLTQTQQLMMSTTLSSVSLSHISRGQISNMF